MIKGNSSWREKIKTNTNEFLCQLPVVLAIDGMNNTILYDMGFSIYDRCLNCSNSTIHYYYTNIVISYIISVFILCTS